MNHSLDFGAPRERTPASHPPLCTPPISFTPRDLLSLPTSMTSKSSLESSVVTKSDAAKTIPHTPQFAIAEDMPAWIKSPQISQLAERASILRDTLDDISKDLSYKISELAELVADLPGSLLGSQEISFSDADPKNIPKVSNLYNASLELSLPGASNLYDVVPELSLPKDSTLYDVAPDVSSSVVGESEVAASRKVTYKTYSKSESPDGCASRSRVTFRSSDTTDDQADLASARTKWGKAGFPMLYSKSTYFFRIRHDGSREIPYSFELLFALIIASNAIFMGYTLQYHSQSGHAFPWAPAVDLAFCIAFIAELCFRVASLKIHFWNGIKRAWNIFDLLVVLCMALDELLRRIARPEWDDPSNLLGALRMFRVARVLRTIKVLHYFAFARYGRLVLLSIKASLGTFLCMFTLSSILVYLLALVTTFGALDHCTKVENQHRLLCERFGTLWRSWYSGYQAFLGGIRWGALVDELYDVGTAYAVIFVLVITFFVIALMHIFIGVFLQIVREVADKSKTSRLMKDHLKERIVFIEQMKRLFDEVDLNADGAITKEDLHLAFENKKISALFIDMELDTIAVENVFDLLDITSSGFVNIDEFAFGCLRLRGKARAVDLERTRRDLVAIRTALDQIKAHVLMLNQSQSSHRVHRHLERKSQLLGVGDSIALARRSKVVPTLKKVLATSQRIESPELRAMTLAELQDVARVVKQRCDSEAWTDPRNGAVLEPIEVNLYHLMFHYISPRTSADCITLVDTTRFDYRRGHILTQLHAVSGHVIGKAEVLEDSDGSNVQIKLLKGQFIAEEAGQASSYRMILDHDTGGLDCGTPSQVLQENSISYKELVSSVPTEPQWFVCHWWGEPILDFVLCCQEHSAKRGSDKYWVCAYANRQHDLGADIGDNPNDSSFRRAMVLAEGLLLVLDPSAVPFQRIWCCFELFKTVTSDKMLDIITMKQAPRLLTQKPLPNEQAIMKFLREKEFPLGVLTKGVQVRLENGLATVEEDKDRILQSMGKQSSTGSFNQDLQEQNMDLANRRLRGYMAVAAWPRAIQKGRVLNFDKKSSEAVSLPEILKQDSDRTALEMFFSGMQEVSDRDLYHISEGLPSKLSSLSLSFEGCIAITDGGLNCLADRMSTLPLEKLVLDFGGCKLLTDASILHLSTTLPSTLVDVSLVFALIPNISKHGAKSLADHLPASVSRLRATFRGTQFDHQFDTIKQLKKMTR